MFLTLLTPFIPLICKILDLILEDVRATPMDIRQARIVANYQTFRPIMMLLLNDEGKKAVQEAEKQGG